MYILFTLSCLMNPILLIKLYPIITIYIYIYIITIYMH